MRIRLTDSPPRGSAFTRVAFLHEGTDPAAGAPRSVRGALRTAAKAAGFRGRAKERAPGSSGGWALYG
ncbi:MAG: hypothetical protein WAU32_03980, partial [Thermoanaerobaculia bacterium]